MINGIRIRHNFHFLLKQIIDTFIISDKLEKI
nr:MAG TPA: hypothetical protein [Caudoviricetes sp.]